MRYGHLWEIRPQTLDIGLESFIVGPGVFDKMRPPSGDTNSKITRAVFKLLEGEPVFIRLSLESQTPSLEFRETEAKLS